MTRFFIFLTAIVAATAIGCKKDRLEDPNCSLNVITPSFGAATNLYYNSEGKLISIKFNDLNTSFEYKGDSIIVIKKQGPDFDRKWSYKMNSDGLPIALKKDYNAAGTQFERHVFEYEGTEIKKITITTSSSSTIVIVLNHTWKNGNLISQPNGLGVTYTYEYYDELPSTVGDIHYLETIINQDPVYLIRNKNMVKKITETTSLGSSSRQYEYSFDKNGKVSAVKRIDPVSPFHYDLQYKCD